MQANGLVDLEIPALSEAQPGAKHEPRRPSDDLNRHISTSLTLKDGGSLVMGGLIANNRSAGQTGVPVLGRIPGLGRLFRSDSLQEDRTELLIMVIPYVVATHAEGSALTEELKQQLTCTANFALIPLGRRSGRGANRRGLKAIQTDAEIGRNPGEYSRRTLKYSAEKACDAGRKRYDFPRLHRQPSSIETGTK